jgi:hypothetical protein
MNPSLSANATSNKTRGPGASPKRPFLTTALPETAP